MKQPLNVAWALSANTGDHLTPWLIEKITGVTPFYVDSLSSDFEHYIVSGSVASAASRHSICWGPGIMFGYERPHRMARWLAVRGPITRSAILTAGGKCDQVFGDPGILCPRFIKGEGKKYDLTIIPHYIDQARINIGWMETLIRDKVHVVNVWDPIDKVCKEIAESENVYSSSLHGCILADAYGVPWKWVKFSNNVGGDDSKFMDFFLSVGREDMSFFDMRDKAYCKGAMMGCVKTSCTPEDRMKRLQEGLIKASPFSGRWE